jgi:hypothetical protein
MDEPGSPVALDCFARWCRVEIDDSVAADEDPSLLFAYGPDFEEPLVLGWHLVGERLDTEELITRLVPPWITRTGASQIGIVVPFGRPRPGVNLIAVDELELVAERSYLDIGRLRLGEWEAVPCRLPFTEWQAAMGTNAGWQELAKWRCRRCESVCPGEAAVVPNPCDFCGSTEIERVDLATPLREPDPPWQTEIPPLLELIGNLPY